MHKSQQTRAILLGSQLGRFGCPAHERVAHLRRRRRHRPRSWQPDGPPVGSQDGGIAAHNAFGDGELRPVNHRVIPRTISTDPPIATVGLTEEEAISAGHNCWCNTVPTPPGSASAALSLSNKQLARPLTFSLCKVSRTSPTNE